MPTVYFNGKFIPENQALVPINTHALHYGTGCFEGIRAYYSEKENALLVFRMQDHYKRFLQSCKILMTTPEESVDKLCEITTKLIQKNFEKIDLYIRPLAYKADRAVGNFNLKFLKNGLAIYTIAFGRYLNTDKGIRANVSSWRRIPDNVIPARAKITGGYVNSSLAKTESLLAGYEEALFLDNQGHVMEGTGENIFIVRDGIVITPPESDDILIGITRLTVMTLLKNDLGITVIERSIDRAELYQTDEVFVVGTAAEVTPVVEIDGRIISNGKIGKITADVKDLYFKLVHGDYPKYRKFITKVEL
ncbi:MAG: branched-chain amino acid transaminase [Candidatus Levyibacteriota bacterium]|nr:MAG: branched-chain amino acid transaminase [Candidatus Levybacteria bacterium]